MPRASLKQRKDGRYKCKYKGIQFMGVTQTEAYAKLDAYKRLEASGLRAEAAGVTFSQYAAKWIETYKGGVSTRTYNDYLRVLHQFVKVVGDKPIKNVIPSDIQLAYNEQQGFSRSHIRIFGMIVNSVFKAAVADRVILHNPCLSAKLPKGKEGSHRAILPWERDLILQSTHRFAPAIMCMLYAGLRRGEVLALDIDRDVDFTAMTISIREAVRFESNQPIITDPKTEAGARTIPMLDVLAARLSGIHGLVAPSASGSLMSETAFNRAWEGFIADLEALYNGDSKRWYGRRNGQNRDAMPPWKSISIRPHDLRHSYCTMLYDAGIDLKTAQKWMGHADQAMTLRIYTHLTAEREEAEARLLRERVNEQLNDGVQNGVQTELKSNGSL